MSQIIDAARDIIAAFPYGPHFTPAQNRALASLGAAIANEQPVTLQDLTERVENLEVWRGNEEQQAHAIEIRKLADEIERLDLKIENLRD